MASAANPVGQAAPGQGGGPPSSGPGPQGEQGLQQVMERFRPVAEQIRALGQQFSEGQEEAVTIMKALQSWMAKVSGNAQRTPEAQGTPTP